MYPYQSFFWKLTNFLGSIKLMRITPRYYRLSPYCKRSLCIFVTYLILKHKDTPKSWATRLDKTSYLDQNVSQTYQTKIFKTGRLWSFLLKKPEVLFYKARLQKKKKKKKWITGYFFTIWVNNLANRSSFRYF